MKSGEVHFRAIGDSSTWRQLYLASVAMAVVLLVAWGAAWPAQVARVATAEPYADTAQSTIRKPATRSNSRVLLVTTVRPRLLACPAIRAS